MASLSPTTSNAKAILKLRPLPPVSPDTAASSAAAHPISTDIEPRSQIQIEKPHIVWDEDNIKLTYHPEGKDYGNMKIDEPDMPFQDHILPDEDVPDLDLDSPFHKGEEASHSANLAVDSVEANHFDKAGDRSSEEGGNWSDDEAPESKNAPRGVKDFESLRAEHYNMKEAMARAKELLATEESDGDDL